MFTLKAAVCNEIMKTLTKKKTWGLLIFSAFILIVLATGIAVFYNKVGIQLLGAADFPIWVLGFFTSFFLPLYVYMFCADSFAGEYEAGTLKIALLRPVNRSKVYLAKLLAVFGILTLLIAVIATLSILASFLVTTGGSNISFVIRSAAAYLLSLIPILPVLVLAAFLAQIIRSGSGVLAVGIIIYLGAKGLPFFSATAGKITPFSNSSWHLLWLGSPINWLLIGQDLLVFLAYIFILLPLGMYIFERREF